jgi:hypothetical protein
VDADPENANQSANQRKKKKCTDITLLERLLLELVYFLMTGEHLDTNFWTLCAGSRHSDGFVPHVHFDSASRRVYVDRCRPDFSLGRMRSRTAVPKNS